MLPGCEVVSGTVLSDLSAPNAQTSLHNLPVTRTRLVFLATSEILSNDSIQVSSMSASDAAILPIILVGPLGINLVLVLRDVAAHAPVAPLR